MPGVVLVFSIVGVDERVYRRMPATVHLHEHAVAAHADRGPHADHRVGAEHVVGHLERYGEYVLAGERVLPGPLESVQGAFRVGKERIAAHTDEQPARAGLDGLRGGIEADRRGGDEHIAGWLGLAGLAAGGVVGGAGLRAVLKLGEHERERGVGVRVAVIVDVDPVDRVRVEIRAGHERVGVDDQPVLSGLSDDLNTKRSVKSRRASSPGNLRLAALKWLDIVAPFLGSGLA